jgi:dTDP-L-rhamnose 4-epimerase
MKDILITGGAGFIGSYLCEALYDKGYSLTVLDNLSPQIHSNAEESYLYKKVKGKCRFIKGDVCNKEDWRKALKGADAIVHLAAETGTGQSMYEVERYYKINIQGTALLFDMLVNEKHHVQKLIIASSRAIYGEGKYKGSAARVQYPESRKPADMLQGIFDLLDPETNEPMQMLPTDENSKLHPSSVYGLTKLGQEQMCMLMGKQMDIPTVALRFQNVYGPGQSLSNPYTGLLAVFSNRIRNGNAVEIYEDGNETRDFVYIKDVIHSIILSLERKEADHQIFNVGSGVATPIAKVAELLCRYFDGKIPIIVSRRFRVGDIRHNCADLTFIEKKLGFQPSVLFEEGLKYFVDWAKQQEKVNDFYEASVHEIMAKGLMK